MRFIKTVVVAVFMAFTVSAVIPETVEARPSKHYSYKKKVSKYKKPSKYKNKYSRYKKSKYVKNTKQKKKVNAVKQVNNCFANSNDSAASFFACDRNQNVITSNSSTTTNSNFWGSSSNVINVASRYEGLHARRNRKKLTQVLSKPFNRVIDPAIIPWCAAFANAVLEEAGYNTTRSLLARSFLGYGQKTGSPQKGDLVVFSRGRNRQSGHVGFFVGYDNTRRYVMVLGGNQNKQVGVVRYPASRVLGYRKITT